MRFNQNVMSIMLVLSVAVAAQEAGAQERDRDPFVSILDLQQQKMKVDLSKVSLKGIIWEAARPVAIINDTLVTVGDEFFGFIVASIDKDKVTLTMGKESYMLAIEDVFSQGQAPIKQNEGPAQKQTGPLLSAPPASEGGRPNENPVPDI